MRIAATFLAATLSSMALASPAPAMLNGKAGVKDSRLTRAVPFPLAMGRRQTSNAPTSSPPVCADPAAAWPYFNTADGATIAEQFRTTQPSPSNLILPPLSYRSTDLREARLCVYNGHNTANLEYTTLDVYNRMTDILRSCCPSLQEALHCKGGGQVEFNDKKGRILVATIQASSDPCPQGSPAPATLDGGRDVKELRRATSLLPVLRREVKWDKPVCLDPALKPPPLDTFDATGLADSIRQNIGTTSIQGISTGTIDVKYARLCIHNNQLDFIVKYNSPDLYNAVTDIIRTCCPPLTEAALCSTGGGTAVVYDNSGTAFSIYLGNATQPCWQQKSNSPRPFVAPSCMGASPQWPPWKTLDGKELAQSMTTRYGSTNYQLDHRKGMEFTVGEVRCCLLNNREAPETARFTGDDISKFITGLLSCCPDAQCPGGGAALFTDRNGVVVTGYLQSATKSCEG